MLAHGRAMTEGLITMARRRGKWTFSRGAAVVLIALGLVACGETVAPTDPGEEITPPVPLSPTAGEIPEDTFQATATITDGAWTQIGSPVRSARHSNSWCKAMAKSIP